MAHVIKKLPDNSFSEMEYENEEVIDMDETLKDENEEDEIEIEDDEDDEEIEEKSE